MSVMNEKLLPVFSAFLDMIYSSFLALCGVAILAGLISLVWFMTYKLVLNQFGFFRELVGGMQGKGTSQSTSRVHGVGEGGTSDDGGRVNGVNDSSKKRFKETIHQTGYQNSNGQTPPPSVRRSAMRRVYVGDGGEQIVPGSEGAASAGLPSNRKKTRRVSFSLSDESSEIGQR
ncbi:hypothetical protein BC832DRAFT_556415 [Gaertneriomyces semiglobifer]|nr:hypothetical protein BC832DRAFT_556415 [Gaertneriomyces semiglobifer]